MSEPMTEPMTVPDALRAERELCVLIAARVPIQLQPEMFAAVMKLKDALLATPPAEPNTMTVGFSTRTMASGAMAAPSGAPQWMAEKTPAETPSGWQPIATAPKDGTTIIVRCPTQADRHHCGVNDVRVVFFGRNHWLSIPGWWTSHPIEWMPLPAPPSEREP